MGEMWCSQARKVSSGVERCKLTLLFGVCFDARTASTTVPFRKLLHYNVHNGYILLCTHNVTQLLS